MASKLRELMLLRHAKSDWKEDGLADIDRPLSDKGKKNAAKLGKWLNKHNLMPDLILVSPALRAQQTLRRICNECSATAITVEALYLADVAQLKQVLAEAPFAERIMLIGHNPGLESLFNLLVAKPDTSHVQLFPTCGMAHLIMPSDWKSIEPMDGKLQQFITPKDIKNNP
ncbi:phosphoglycerate mutase [Thiomicrorhabdus immobilis]|uniref:Phosphoglycerate mutase n=1 Tax=Thiomicrorhabdus immobilis TaxID=2791037 RepID=A0ABN6CYZ8_9GAMM|nr:histidine phosphatase family protein [Thiomicrorhabdus immobilis]BCN94173.1 phosphoglycerate mutase [Thiomicrorhabdus immobilis]